MGAGLQKAFAAANSTTMKPEQAAFLHELLRWDGVATPQQLGPQTTQAQNAARQTCKRRGWVSYDGYWRITEVGRQVFIRYVNS